MFGQKDLEFSRFSKPLSSVLRSYCDHKYAWPLAIISLAQQGLDPIDPQSMLSFSDRRDPGSTEFSMSTRFTVISAVFQNPEQMREAFQQFLQPVDGSAIDVQSCTIDYVRESPQRNVYQYTLGVVRPGDGRMIEQIVTSTTYRGTKTGEVAERLLKRGGLGRTAVGALLLPALTYIPSHDALVQTFPFDYRLPGLIQVVNGAPAFVAALRGDLATEDWQAGEWDAEVVRYRPDMRATVRIGMRASNAEDFVGRRVFAKVYREEDEGRRAFDLLQVLWDKTDREDLGFAVPRPIAFMEKERTLLLQEVAGARLLQLVRQGKAAEAVSAITMAARAIAGMHQMSLPEGMIPLARMDKAKQLADVASTLAEYCPNHGAAIDELVVTIGQSLRDAPQAPTHFDLKQGHILLDGSRVTILDFDKMALGDPLVDVGNILATLGAERERGSIRAERRSGLPEAFTEEYFKRVPAQWQERFSAHFALATLVEAGTTGRGRRGRPEIASRSERATNAIAQAERIMAGELS